MNNLLEILKTGKVLICDGAMGSELHKKGLNPGDCPEEWNLTHQKKIQQIHSEYINAGVNIILTNTFGGNYLKLKTCGKEGSGDRFNKKGVDVAREAVQSHKFISSEPLYIFGDIGPTGQIMESSGGTLKSEEAIIVFQEQIRALFSGTAKGDYIAGVVFETFEDIEEIKAGITAAKNIQTKEGLNFLIIASMTFHPGARGFRTIMGTSVEKAVQELEKAGVDIIGTNCGNGPEEMTEIIKEMRKYTSLPLIAQPNAGLPVLKEGKTIFPLTPEAFAEFGPKLCDAGANIIGGCCGTTPEHIKLLAEKIKE